MLQSNRNLHVLMASTSSYTVSSTTSTRLPIRNLTDRISYDILSEIFLSIVQDEARCLLSSFALPPGRYPWTLAGICTQWRKICLTTPRLWSYISLRHICRAQPSLQRTQLQLERAPNPTPLVINAGQLCICEDHGLLWKTIAPSSHRWEEVSFGYSRGTQQRFSELLYDNTGFANVRRITFESRYNSERYLRPIPFPMGESNRSLVSVRSLTLQDVDDIHSLGDSFPLDRLTSLSFVSYNGKLTDILSILTRCQNLVHFDLSSSADNTGKVDGISKHFGGVEKASVCLPNLASLTLVDETFIYAMNVLPFLRLPSLRALGISFIETEVVFVEDCELLMNLIYLIPTGPSGTLGVTELSMVFLWCFGTMRLVDLLKRFPRLRELRFEGASETLLESLRQEVAPGDGYPCPDLERLRLDYEPDVDPCMLLEMIELRMKDGTSPRASLKSIHISYVAPTVDPSVWRKEFDNYRSVVVGGLDQFIKNGLEVCFLPAY